MVVREAITSALQLIAVVASGEVPSGQESVDGLLALNLILDGWSGDRNNLYDNNVLSYTLSSDTTELSLGTGQTLNIPVDSYIETVAIGSTEFTFAGTQDRIQKIPNKYYVQNSRPIAKLGFAVPQVAGSVVSIYYRPPLAQYTSLDDELLLPSGYLQAIIYSLAKELTTQYGVQFTDANEALMKSYVTSIRRTNMASSSTVVSAIPDINKAMGFNIYAGT
jgi:hypothetical protein